MDTEKDSSNEEEAEPAAAAAPPADAEPESRPEPGPVEPATQPTPLAEVADIVARAAEAQAEWAERPVAERADIVAQVKRRLLGRAAEIGLLLHQECGKPVEEAVLSEVLPSADVVDYWTESIEELLEPRPVELSSFAYPRKHGVILRAPRGVVALIAPWNFPLAIPWRSLVPALCAGNAVVLKPSELAPRAGALLLSLFEGLLPDGLVGLVQGGAEAGAALARAAVDLVVFTGSTRAGREVAQICAERLVPCSLELGGKDAAIVLRDCRIERTARGIAWAAFNNAGQSCCSVERVYVEKAIAERFLARLVAVTKELRARLDVGTMPSAAQKRTVAGLLAETVEAGAEVLVGGAPDGDDPYFPPTIVKVAAPDCPLLRDEIFGPVLPVLVVADEDEAVAQANASRCALTTSIWTRRTGHGRDLARALRAGVVTVNNHGFTAALPAAPWTGAGESGSGVTNSPHALEALTRPRFVLVDRSWASRELWWYPYTGALGAIAFALARLRGGAGFFGRIVAFFRLLGALIQRALGR